MTDKSDDQESSVSSIGSKIFNEEDTKFWEKLLQFFKSVKVKSDK